uniref:G-protein coupled receptors family 1 profile domain-containing protein n=1 Tax=Astyanax mexicanus TaxID=7994 RepID=A0A3B1K0M7_ASTMX
TGTMAVSRTVLLLALLIMVSVGNWARGWTFSCPQICRCSPDRVTCTRHTQTQNSSPRISSLTECMQLISLFYFSLFFSSLIQNINQLLVIENGAFTDLPKLKYLSICNTGMRHFPDLSTIASMELYFFLNLVRNGFTEIRSHAFNGTKLDKLILKNNRQLTKIHDDALVGALGPNLLDLSSTALRSLPLRGLRDLKVLVARSAPDLKTLPPLESLQDLQEAELTYPSHCCAFHTWRRNNRENAIFSRFRNLTRLCNMDNQPDLMYTIKTVNLLMEPFIIFFSPYIFRDPSAEDLSDLYDINFHYPDLDLCASSTSFKCTPEPDAFNPCEDLLGYGFLRSITWIITVFALLGNLAVLIVLLSSHQKLTVSRFLMCNLAFADLCMGLYLLLIALVDYRSQQEYYNHATDWQTGAGCGIAGFLTVFASELSVYTLTMITLERWHTINYAMQRNRRLRLRQIMSLMAFGWVFSILVALLPVLGISSYIKVSICLPMDIETPASQGYVLVVLVLNMAAFLMVCCCYVGIYLSVHNPNVITRHGDTRIAKRMAVLIFTDFLCMVPISFFAISAALRMPLITVSQSKILLVLFYPINSLCNPFLYTIFTRAFRRDMYLLLSRCGCCQTQAEFYRVQGLSAVTLASKNKNSRKSRSNQFHAYHIKLQGCFFNKDAT